MLRRSRISVAVELRNGTYVTQIEDHAIIFAAQKMKFTAGFSQEENDFLQS